MPSMKATTGKLNGSKIFITNAGYANVFIIIAVTGTVLDKRGRKQKEISAFIVERTDPGFKVGKPEDKMGIRGSSTCELIMEDCIIPKDRLLGVKGRGFQLAMATLDGGPYRPSPPRRSASPKARLDETVAYVKERKQFGPFDRGVPEHPVRTRRDEGPCGTPPSTLSTPRPRRNRPRWTAPRSATASRPPRPS